MSDLTNENTTSKGHSISYETIAQGKIRVKTKIWVDDLDITKGIEQSAELYKGALEKMRSEGFIIDGDLPVKYD